MKHQQLIPSTNYHFGFIIFVLIFSIICLSLYPKSNVTARSTQKSLKVDNLLSLLDLITIDPFGEMNFYYFQPRYTYDINNNLIENTDYGITNPDLGSRTTCFHQPFNIIFHAGEDLYFINRSVTTSNFYAKAIADGTVVYASTADQWPGQVVMIRHNTSSGYVYSVYMHLTAPSVAVGQYVTMGTTLGQILYQPYSGAYPQYHTYVDDSHLHFEIRNFFDASNIYSYSECNGTIPGRGYTYPQLPDVFPNNNNHYYHPSVFIY